MEPQEIQEMEDKATRQGWKPQDDYHGDPGNWKSAEDFLKTGDNIAAILKERLSKTDEKLAQLEQSSSAQLRELKTVLKNFSAHHKGTAEREYKKAVATLEAKQRKAVEDQDTDAFDTAKDGIEVLKGKMEADVKKEAQTTQGVPDSPEDTPAFKEWHGENAWYKTDMELTRYADSASDFVKQMHPGLVESKDAKKFFELVTEEVKLRFPEKFENQNRNRQSSVDSVSNSSGGGKQKGKKNYANLPAEDKKACDKFVEEGLLSKEQYCAEYDWEE